MAKLLRQFTGTGDKISAVINLDHIGTYVARIIADPRTLNKWVFVYEEEVTLSEIFELAGRAAGEKFRENAEVVSTVSSYPSAKD